MTQGRSAAIVHLRPEDNVAVAARPLDEGASIHVNGTALQVSQRIGMGHKVAVARIARGEPVRKYGQVIGFASEDVPAGAWVHTHNVEPGHFDRDYAYASEVPPRPKPKSRGPSKATGARVARWARAITLR